MNRKVFVYKDLFICIGKVDQIYRKKERKTFQLLIYFPHPHGHNSWS